MAVKKKTNVASKKKTSTRKGTTSRTPRAATKTGRRKTARKKMRRSFWQRLRRVPSWSVLLGATTFVALLVMLFYWIFIGPYSFRWKAMYGDPVYPEGFDVHGIDVSHYQEAINWEQVRNASLDKAPVSFVIIKATEGMTLVDDKFEYNFRESKENGLIRGAYHFFVPGTDAREQASFFIRNVRLEPGDLPPVLDVEKIGKLDKETLVRDVKTWLDMAEEAYGVKPILYTGYKFKMTYLDAPMFDAYPYWIAHYYVEALKYKATWHFWQHTDRGEVQGIRGRVDCNVFNGSLEDLSSLLIRDSVAVEPPLPFKE